MDEFETLLSFVFRLSFYAPDGLEAVAALCLQRQFEKFFVTQAAFQHLPPVKKQAVVYSYATVACES